MMDNSSVQHKWRAGSSKQYNFEPVGDEGAQLDLIAIETMLCLCLTGLDGHVRRPTQCPKRRYTYVDKIEGK